MGYIIGDSRIAIGPSHTEKNGTKRNTVTFSSAARGTPGNVHGGAIGSVFLSLCGEGCVASVHVDYHQVIKLNRPVNLEMLPGKECRLCDHQGNKLSSGVVEFIPRSKLTFITCPSSIWRWNLRTQLITCKYLVPVLVPSFQQARKLFPNELENGYSHFEFHKKPRLKFEAFRDSRDGTLHGILVVDSDATSDTSGIPSVSESALFVAADEFMGGTVSATYKEPLVTACLTMEFSKGVVFNQRQPAVFYVCAKLKKEIGSRKVISSCSMHAITASVPNIDAITLPIVTRSSAIFVLLANQSNL